MAEIDYDKLLVKICKKVAKLEKKDFELFFRAFFTPSELQDFCDRYLIVKGLIEGNSQREIATGLGVSLSKVGSGVKELKYKYGKKIFDKFIKL